MASKIAKQKKKVTAVRKKRAKVGVKAANAASKRGGGVKVLTDNQKQNVCNHARVGMVDSQLHYVAKVTAATFRDMRKREPDFDQAIKEARASALKMVGSKLFEAATGMEVLPNGSYTERTEIKVLQGQLVELPATPNVTAMIFFLKAQGLWRENVVVEVDIEVDGKVKVLRYLPLTQADVSKMNAEREGEEEESDE